MYKVYNYYTGHSITTVRHEWLAMLLTVGMLHWDYVPC